MNPTLIDVSIKEGAFLVQHRILLEHVSAITAGLAISGIEYAEISHGHGVGSFKRGKGGLHTDEELLESAQKAAPQLKLGSFFSGASAWREDVDSVAEFIHFGRVGCNCDDLEHTKTLVQRLKEFKKHALVQFMRVHRFPIEQVCQAAQTVQDMGADVLYITDTYGSMSDQDVAHYISALTKTVDIPIGFQGRNATGRAMHNTLVAFENGATWLDGALLGAGRGAGTTQLEVLVSHLQSQKLLSEVSLKELCFTAKHHVLPALQNPPHVRLAHCLMAKYKIDFGIDHFLESLSPMLELDQETVLQRMQEHRPNMIQVTDDDLRYIFAESNIDFDIAMEYLSTGEVPKYSDA